MMSDDDYDFTDFEKMPIRSLGPSSRSNLSLSLNPEQLLTSDSDHARDFRGIAELMGFSYAQIQNFKRSSDPLSALLDTYSSRPNGRDATVKDLLLMLEQIGRFDVIDDVMPNLRTDLDTFHEQKNSAAESSVNEVSYDESQILSLDDIITGKETGYDAYVCYADSDLEFVRDLCSHLEDAGISLFIRERNLPAGALQYDVFTQLIEKRCSRVLVVLSPDFLQCRECEFQTKFATSLGVSQRKRKLIPVIYRPCHPLPAALNILTKIDFSRNTDWAWQRLIVSIKTPDSNQSGFIPQTSPTIRTLPSLTQLQNDSDADLIDVSNGVSASAPPLTPSVQMDASHLTVGLANASKQQSTGSRIKSEFSRLKDLLKPSKSSVNSKSRTESAYHLIEKSDLAN